MEQVDREGWKERRGIEERRKKTTTYAK